MKKKLPISRIHRLRLITQIIFLGFFLILFFKTDYNGEPLINTAVKFFLEADPLIAIVVLLEHRGIPSDLGRMFVLSGILLGMTIVLGRFFCGWVCPLGTIHHVAGYRRKLTKRAIDAGIYQSSQKIKYLVLAFVLVCSLFSLQIAGIIDPISLLIRSLTIAVLSPIHFTFEVVSTKILHWDVPLLTPSSEWVYGVAKSTILPFKVYYFSQNILIGILFVTIIVLNRLRPRFWCRFICPLGALLGFSSRAGRVQRHLSESCTKCNICHASCQGAPATEGAENWNAQECFLCMNCQAVCPENAITFSLSTKKTRPIRNILPERRAVLASLGAAAFSVPLLATSGGKVRANPSVIRPPGSQPEMSFLNRCVRCGECMKVCPTNGLHPTFLEAGLDGIWSPRFNMRIGYCEYYCTLCGQVCPTHAIRPLTESVKTQTKIGLAFIDPARCIPYAFGIPCIVCEEHCPTPRKAIIFDEKTIITYEGVEKDLKFPKVVPELCIGCGICENRCPVVDSPAIYVTSIGESRSEENQLILGEEGDSSYP